MTLNDILPYICVSQPSLRSFFLQYMVITTGAQNCTTCWMWETLEHSSPNVFFFFHQLCIKWGRQIIRVNSNGWPQETYHRSTTGLMHIWTQSDCGNTHTPVLFQPRQGPRIERRLWTRELSPQTKKLSTNWCLLAKGKLVFFSGVSLNISTSVQVRPNAQKFLANAKLTQWAFV